MYDRELVLEILKQIANSISIVLKRFSFIKKPDDFVRTEEGLEKLDSICMQLIAIGESLKKIDKITEGTLFVKYPQVEWDKAKKMRDIIAHHYFDIDEEIVFTVCQKHLPLMLEVVKRMVGDLEKGENMTKQGKKNSSKKLGVSPRLLQLKDKENFQKLETVQDLKNFLRDFFQGKKVKVYLFGSRAKGNHTERSDIDVAVLSDEDISFELALLREVIENSNLPQTVDVVDLDTVDPEFREQVLKKGTLWVETWKS